MKKYLFALSFALILWGSPVSAQAAGLTQPQIDAIISLLTAFGVDVPVIESVRAALNPAPQAPAPIVPRSTPQAQTPAATTTPEIATPTFLAVEVNKREVLGANCDPIYASAEVYDQHGRAMNDQIVTLSGPDGSITERTKQHAGDDGQRPSADFAFKPKGTDREDTITFTSGPLSETIVIRIGKGLRGARLISDGSDWYEASGGMRVDRSTLLCK